jgi:hypothetical protein
MRIQPTLLVWLSASWCLLTAWASAADSFEDFLKRVHQRDPKTQAIISVLIGQPETGRTDMVDPVVSIKDNIATFEFSRHSKIGVETARFEFVVTAEVSREIKRIANLRELQALERKVEEATRAYKTFTDSDFRIRVGDTLEQADRQMGQARSKDLYQGTSGQNHIYQFADGLKVMIVKDSVHAAWREKTP